LRTLYLLSVWIHVIAATIWVGGMLFLTLVVVPWLRGPGRATGLAFLRESGRRFRHIAWICFALLIVTGAFNLSMRGVSLASFIDTGWLGSSFGRLVLLKLGFFAVVLLLSALHDFVIGPRAAAALEADPRSAAAQSLRRRASWIGRLNVILGLTLILLGVMIVRGAL
jgi:copper resistance protein D